MDETLRLFFDDGTTSEDKTVSTAKEPYLKDYAEDWLRIRDLNRYYSDGIGNPYENSYIVYRAIRSIAENIPQAKYKIYRGFDEVREHPVVSLFNRPNPFMSRFEMWEAIATYLNLKGEAFIYMIPSVGQMSGGSRWNIPAQLHILNPDYVKHSLHNHELVGWSFGDKLPIDPSEMIHFKLFNPNSFRGLAPYKSIRDELKSDMESGKYNKKFFENNATPDAVIEVDKEKNITIEELRRLKQDWHTNYGGTDASHKTAFLLGGMTFKHMSMSQKEMDFINSRQFNRQTILSVYGVPTFVAGFTDKGDVNRSTAQAAMELFWKNTLKPQLTRIEEKLRVEFFERYAPDLDGRFDYSSISELRQDLKASMEDALKLQMLGYSTNEINRRLELNMPESTDLDVRHVPSNLMPFEVDEPEDDIETDSKESDNKEIVAKELITKAQRDTFRRMFEANQDKHENTFHKKIKSYFFNLRKETLKLVNGKKGVGLEGAMLLANIKSLFDDNEDNLITMVTPIYQETSQTAGDMVYDVLGLSKEFIVNESIIGERQNKIRGMNTTVYDQLKNDLTEGLKNGETIDELSTRVKGVFNTTANRARVIARTETTSLMNAQTNKVYEEEGINQREWIASSGARESHARVDGEVRSIGELFSNGLMYPGDPNGPAAEVVNCRCTVGPILS